MLTVQIGRVDTAVLAKTVFKATVKTPVKTSMSVQAETNAQNLRIVTIQKADMIVNVCSVLKETGKDARTLMSVQKERMSALMTQYAKIFLAHLHALVTMALLETVKLAAMSTNVTSVSIFHLFFV